MATQGIDVLSLTFKARGAVAKLRAVGFDGAQITAIGAPVLGVSPRPADNGTFSDAVVLGTQPMTLGGTVSAGQRVASDATGRAITLASALASNPNAESFGRALEGGFEDDAVEILLGR